MYPGISCWYFLPTMLEKLVKRIVANATFVSILMWYINLGSSNAWDFVTGLLNKQRKMMQLFNRTLSAIFPHLGNLSIGL